MGKYLNIIQRSAEKDNFIPGVPMELADRAAKASDKVGQVNEVNKVTIEPAAQNASAVFWETTDGRILGPAVPEFLAQDGSTFWIVTTFKGQTRWINSDRLRSRNAFHEQAEVREVEPIRTL